MMLAGGVGREILVQLGADHAPPQAFFIFRVGHGVGVFNAAGGFVRRGDAGFDSDERLDFSALQQVKTAVQTDHRFRAEHLIARGALAVGRGCRPPLGLGGLLGRGLVGQFLGQVQVVRVGCRVGFPVGRRCLGGQHFDGDVGGWRRGRRGGGLVDRFRGRVLRRSRRGPAASARPAAVMVRETSGRSRRGSCGRRFCWPSERLCHNEDRRWEGRA